jgi:hypothetical protein
MWKEQLIALYCAVCHAYSTTLAPLVQRMSNNCRPQITDEEVMTIYIWGILQRRFEQKAMYQYTKDHLLDWFPKLPSYQEFSRRLNNLCPAFSRLGEYWLEHIAQDSNGLDILLGDSMPIKVARGPRSARAKVAPGLCAHTYNASRKEWYYGMKLHAIVQKVRVSLPVPKLVTLTKASCHDLPVARELIRDNPCFAGSIHAFMGDKAYCDCVFKELLSEQGINLCTPVKAKRGQEQVLPGSDIRDILVSRTRQAIESFFNWLHEKTGIQAACKARSEHGLLLHVFGRLASAFYLLAFKPAFNS